jgi:hypothetical protein
MNIRFMAAVLTGCQILIGTSPLRAQDQFGISTRAEKRAYHACLYADRINNYCRFHAWGFTELSFRDCIIANGGYLKLSVADACPALFQIHGDW